VTGQAGRDYTGYERTENFASPGGARPGKPHAYTIPAEGGSTSGPCPGTGLWRTRPPR